MRSARNTQQGLGHIDVLLGLVLGLAIWAMVLQVWGAHQIGQNQLDAWQELQNRTSFLHRLLSRLSRQAGSRPLTWTGQHWEPGPAYVALPAGAGPTWVHARAVHDPPALYPNCQNTRVWAKDAAHAPAELRDQFSWIEGQLKCKDLAQTSARWQTWVEQVRDWQVWLAWRSGDGVNARWQWHPADTLDAGTIALGVRMCLTLDSIGGVTVRPAPPLDCHDQPLKDQGRLWRVWTRAWALRVESP
ncbi:MAG: hypothetical protein RL657_1998 [Pseudomonadota bacterium]